MGENVLCPHWVCPACLDSGTVVLCVVAHIGNVDLSRVRCVQATVITLIHESQCDMWQGTAGSVSRLPDCTASTGVRGEGVDERDEGNPKHLLCCCRDSLGRKVM